MTLLNEADMIYLGDISASAVYLGVSKVWAPPQVDVDVAAWVQQVINNGGTVSAARQALVSDLIIGLKDDAIWNKLDRLWLLAGENEPSAQTDIVSRVRATKIGVPNFIVDRGYGGFTLTDYVDTNFNPATAGGHFLQNDNALSVWIDTAPIHQPGLYPDAIGGYASSSGSLAQLEYNPDHSNWGTRLSNGGGVILEFPFTGPGFMCSTRLGSNSMMAYVNGTFAASGGGASLTLPNTRLFIGNRGDDNVPQPVCVFTGGRISLVHAGGSLTATDQSNLYARVNAYMVGLGSLG